MRNILKFIWKGWSAFIIFVNKTIVCILLALLFLLLITPQAFFRKLINKKNPRAGWILRKHSYNFKDLERLW